MKKTTIALLSEFAPLEPTYALVSDVDLVMVRSEDEEEVSVLYGRRQHRGAMGVRVSKVGQLDAALEKTLSHPGPALVEVMTDVELI